jgi:hypothetical protein
MNDGSQVPPGETPEEIAKLLSKFYATVATPPEIEQRLRNLKTPAAQQAVVHSFIYDDYRGAHLGKIVVECGYEPTEPTERLVFFFLTKQFAKYNTLDFDRSLLRAVFEKTEHTVRWRISTIVRESGNPDYLDILSLRQADKDTRISTEQQKSVLTVLKNKQDWAGIWQKVFELPAKGSFIATNMLVESGWQPASPTEREVFKKLATFTDPDMKFDNPFEFMPSFSPTVSYIEFKVPGKTGAMAFTPDSKELAVIQTDPKPGVFLLNPFTGEIKKTLTDFGQPVGSIAYLPSGKLLIGERPTDSQADGALYIQQGVERRKLGVETGGLIFLAALIGTRFIAINRAGQTKIWDAATEKVVADLGDTQAAIALPILELKRLVLLGKRACVYNLKTLKQLSDNADNPKFETTPTVAMFNSEQEIVVGTITGKRETCSFDGKKITDIGGWSDFQFGGSKSKKAPVLTMQEWLPADAYIQVIGAAEIKIERIVNRFLPMTMSQPDHKKYTGAAFSPTQEFLMVGLGDGRMELTDLRPLLLWALMIEPLTAATLQHLEAVEVLLKMQKNYTKKIKKDKDLKKATNTVHYLDVIFRHKFQYDIELEPALVKPGMTDIEIQD